jgi:Sporulation and spore germination
MTRRRLVLLVVACLVALAAPAVAPAAAAAPAPPPLLTAVRASHHPGFDRIVFDFLGGVPASRSARYVTTLTADPSGFPITIAGRAILEVSFFEARGRKLDGTDTAPNRTVFDLPNVLTAVQSGDGFENVVSYGIGLAANQPFRISTLSNPPRVVLDIDTDFSWTNRPVWFVNQSGNPASVLRPISTSSPAHALMDRLFAGPTAGERASGLLFVKSGATDYRNLTISSGLVARVQLVGGCSSGGSTVTIADEIMPTLRQLPNVSWVKVYDPAGNTEQPTGTVDSIPECLEP